jgi:hypothetical protein
LVARFSRDFAVSRLWLQFRRYSAWSMFGILICVWAVLPFPKLRGNADFLLGLICAGGSSFVLLRAAVGIATRWAPGKADRATAKIIGLFVIGGLCSFLLLTVSVTVDSAVSRFVKRWAPGIAGYPLLAFIVIGGLVAVLVGGLTRGKRAWLFLPITWLMASIAVVVWLLALSTRV